MSNRCHWSACSFERNVLGRVIFPEALMHRKYMFRYILNGIRKVKYITVYKKKNALKYINLQPIICLFIRYVIVPDFFSMVVFFYLKCKYIEQCGKRLRQCKFHFVFFETFLYLDVFSVLWTRIFKAHYALNWYTYIYDYIICKSGIFLYCLTVYI